MVPKAASPLTGLTFERVPCTLRLSRTYKVCSTRVAWGISHAVVTVAGGLVPFHLKLRGSCFLYGSCEAAARETRPGKRRLWAEGVGPLAGPRRRMVWSAGSAVLADAPGSVGALLACIGVRAGGKDDDTRGRGRSPCWTGWRCVGHMVPWGVMAAACWSLMEHSSTGGELLCVGVRKAAKEPQGRRRPCWSSALRTCLSQDQP